MAENPSTPATSIPSVETDSETLGILFDVLSVLNDQSLSHQIAGEGFTDSLNLAIYQLKGVTRATVSNESVRAYPWVSIPKNQFVERVADLAIQAIESIEEDS